MCAEPFAQVGRRKGVPGADGVDDVNRQRFFVEDLKIAAVSGGAAAALRDDDGMAGEIGEDEPGEPSGVHYRVEEQEGKRIDFIVVELENGAPADGKGEDILIIILFAQVDVEESLCLRQRVERTVQRFGGHFAALLRQRAENDGVRRKVNQLGERRIRERNQIVCNVFRQVETLIAVQFRVDDGGSGRLVVDRDKAAVNAALCQLFKRRTAGLIAADCGEQVRRFAELCQMNGDVQRGAAQIPAAGIDVEKRFADTENF